MAGLGRSRPKRDRGAALVMVLWGAVVMSIIAAAAARQASTAAVVVNVGGELTRARALADGGVRLGWSAFADGAIRDFTPIWACRSGEDTLFVQIRPEFSRIDINVASKELLAALFTEAGASRQAAEEMAAAAIAYRTFGEIFDDNGDSAPVRQDDREPAQLAAGQFMRGPFQTIEELGYLPGMDVTLYRALVDDISVHSRSSDIDRRFASDNVLKAADAVARTEGLMVGASPEATTSGAAADPAPPAVPPFEGSLLNVRAIAVTGSGAVFVRDAVVEGPIDSDGKPNLLRFVQGRLRDGETLPSAGNAPSCAQGFSAIRSRV